MTTKKQRADTDIDRKPWAAYTLGHHPYALGIWHEHRWFEIASDSYDAQGERTGITGLLDDLDRAGITFKDLDTKQSSLEDIFVDLVKQ